MDSNFRSRQQTLRRSYNRPADTALAIKVSFPRPQSSGSKLGKKPAAERLMKAVEHVTADPSLHAGPGRQGDHEAGH